MTPANAYQRLDPTQRASVLLQSARTGLDHDLWRIALGDGSTATDAAESASANDGRPTDPFAALLEMATRGPAAPPPPSDTIPVTTDDAAPTTVASRSELSHDLGPNARFRDDLDSAAARTGIPPHTIAALIDTEAAKSRGGGWQVYSRNARSSAAGLGQFLNSSWIGLAATHGTALNAMAQEHGWLDSHGAVREGARAALLQARYDPAVSIDAVADYARLNLAGMRRAGIATDGSPAKTAQLAYLGHHLGLGDAVKFLRGGIGEHRAQVLLSAQIGSTHAASRIAASGGDALVAHHRWLTALLDRHFPQVA